MVTFLCGLTLQESVVVSFSLWCGLQVQLITPTFINTLLSGGFFFHFHFINSLIVFILLWIVQLLEDPPMTPGKLLHGSRTIVAHLNDMVCCVLKGLSMFYLFFQLSKCIFFLIYTPYAFLVECQVTVCSLGPETSTSIIIFCAGDCSMQQLIPQGLV